MGYLVSIAYYLGYWGTLEVDVFNYFDVQDFVKGITYPVRNVVISVAAAAIATPFIFYLIKYSNKYPYVFILIFIVLILVLQLSGVIDFTRDIKFTYYDLQRKEFEGQKAFITFFSMAAAGTLAFYAVKEDTNKYKFWLHYTGFLFVVLFPLATYHEAQESAWVFKKNYKFDYIITPESMLTKTLTRQVLLKYAGKVGSYYCFITVNNKQRIIASQDEIKSLVLEHYDGVDSTKIIRFNYLIEKELK